MKIFKRQKYIVFLAIIILCGTVNAAPVIDQANNLLGNGSLESGSFDPVTGHAVNSAADKWNHWNVTTTELITEQEMLTQYGVGLQDGNAAMHVQTSSSGPYSSYSYGHNGWASNITQDMTFSGWVYVISGQMIFSVGSNGSYYNSVATTKTGEWEFISVSKVGASGNQNDEILLYEKINGSEFIVDSLWLNTGLTSLHPDQTGNTYIPELSNIFLGIIAIISICFYRKR